MVAQIESHQLKPRLVRKFPRGVVQVFTTTAPTFQTEVMVNALRSASQGNKVLIAQFFKGGIGQGPDKPRKLAENLEWLRSDLSRPIDLANPALEAQEKENILTLWHLVANALHCGHYHLIVLDELPGLIKTGLLEESVVLHAIEQRADKVNVIVTGIDIPQSLVSMADLVTHKRI